LFMLKFVSTYCKTCLNVSGNAVRTDLYMYIHKYI